MLSPQRLIYHRNNGYLEAWCHEKMALRRFAVDAFKSLEGLDLAAEDISEAELDAEFNSGYGIYGGKSKNVAELRFSPAAARWVADEKWHPFQIGGFDGEGYYLLKVPYAQPTELMMDILRHGEHVEVIGPPNCGNR